MSQIQEEVKPVIVALFEGKRFEIYRRPRRLISSWAAMSTIAADATSERFAVVSEEERMEFVRNKLPPDHWRIWIDLCSDNIKTPNYRHYSSELLDNNEHHKSGSISEADTIQATIYCIRRLAIHVMTSSNEAGREVIRKWKWRRFKPYLSRVWPVTHAAVTWPPAQELTTADVETLAARLYDKMAEMRVQFLSRPDSCRSSRAGWFQAASGWVVSVSLGGKPSIKAWSGVRPFMPRPWCGRSALYRTR